jgi:hypothetical protein
LHGGACAKILAIINQILEGDFFTMENENAETATETATETAPEQNGGETAGTAEKPVETEEITYNAVQKDGHVTAIWEMQGRRHLRTIDPRSREGLEILRLFTAEHE